MIVAGVAALNLLTLSVIPFLSVLQIRIFWRFSWNLAAVACDQTTVNSRGLIGAGELRLVDPSTLIVSAQTPCTDFSVEGVWSSGTSDTIYTRSAGLSFSIE